jgi:hypothetical protein
MTNDITTRNPSAVSIMDDDLAERLLAGIEQSQSSTLIPGGGKDLIKLDKASGTWTIGQSELEMQEGSNWAVNVLSMCHGYVCWSNYQGTRKNERLGEVMVPMHEPKPPKPQPIEGFPFTEQRSFEAVCLNGEDAGQEVQFKNGSVGTMKAFKKLEDAVKGRLKDTTKRKYPCPVIQFKSDKYKHSDYGWIQNPIFEVVGWANFNGDLEGEAEAEAPPSLATAQKLAQEPVAKEPRKATPKLAAVPEAPAAAPRGQRRRPAA